jgi:signal transduction histidine kinase
MPLPILVVSRSGFVAGNQVFESALGRHATTKDLEARFEIMPWGVGEVESPWERVLRHDFVEDQIWYDRETATRLRYCVRGRSLDDGGVLALEDLGGSAVRMAEFVDAAARSVVAESLEQTGVMLARVVEKMIGADAAFVFVGAANDLIPLATSRADLAPSSMPPAVAARSRSTCEVVSIESFGASGGALRDAGLRSCVACPMRFGGEIIGMLVVAWHLPGPLHVVERRLLEAAATACAAALVHNHARRTEATEAALLYKLRSAALGIGDLSSLHDVIEQLVEQACAIAGARRGGLGLSVPDGGTLAEAVIMDRARCDVGDLESREVRSFLVELATGDHATRRRKSGPSSYVGTRLRLNDRAIGSICLADKQDGSPFTVQDEHVLELFGSQAALAIGYSRQLQRAEEAQRRLASLHDELAAVIAHDMRSPISSILLQIEVLLDRGDKLADHVAVPVAVLGRLHHAGRRISRMADDLLDASRIELRRIALDRRQLRLGEAVSDLVMQIEPTLGGRTIAIDVTGDVPPVSADPLRLDQIVTNLLENAAKYSSPGRPIKIRIEPSGNGATLSVEDEGVGIPADEIPRLFDRFFQAKRARAKKSGLGLGLYITKGLVEAHGGRIWVDSGPGRTEFHVWLPSRVSE